MVALPAKRPYNRIMSTNLTTRSYDIYIKGMFKETILVTHKLDFSNDEFLMDLQVLFHLDLNRSVTPYKLKAVNTDTGSEFTFNNNRQCIEYKSKSIHRIYNDSGNITSINGVMVGDTPTVGLVKPSRYNKTKSATYVPKFKRKGHSDEAKANLSSAAKAFWDARNNEKIKIKLIVK